MEKINYISSLLIRKIDDSGLHGSESEIYLHGEKTGIIVPAQSLETAIRLNDGRYLLFMTDDIPYDESLEILLVKLNEGIQERVTLSTSYGSGTFLNMRLHDKHIEFSYFGDEKWEVEVFSLRSFKLPFGCNFLVTRHPIRLRYFIRISLFR